MTPSRDAPALSEPVRHALEAEIKESLGLVFTRGRGRDFDVGIGRTMQALGLADPMQLLQRLVAREPTAQQALASALTVGETYFFRHPEHFQLVRELALPEALRRRPAGQARLWSAGCATGEEAYSLALVALELLGSAARARVEVLATDLSPTALARARAGRYGPWSFRGVSEEVQRRWFIQEDALRRVAPEAQALVRFEPLNLADAVRPSAPWPADVDVVFCRNVLIYLDEKVRAAFFLRMAAALSLGGWLVLAPSDPVPGSDSGLTPRRERGHNVYQVDAGVKEEACARSTATVAPRSSVRPFSRSEAAAPGDTAAGTPPPPSAALAPASIALAPASIALAPASMPVPTPRSQPRVVPMRAKVAVAETALAPEGGARGVVDVAARGEPPAAEARRLANAGETERALTLLDEAIVAEPMETSLYLLRATVLLDVGRAEAASQDARRAMMLTPQSPAAHLVSAAAAVQTGEEAEAARGLRNARTLLLGLSEGACLADLGDTLVVDALAYCQRLEQALALRAGSKPSSGLKGTS
ncbi:CheR family methyltransferase [Chondromyces crocatus]|uniref:CheR-type methyltransferase domain-containing protein n=1 Tax=Chondromyces crocatus TaxID=52 RepID=A0A0K1EGJ1_CHOCO|nr:protein-glutamate O-methyltransferase CheR [Chondromyces crocatus]AKT39698.1 uncharacterized protein CMC5_038470 [Chondromyces crocatus]